MQRTAFLYVCCETLASSAQALVRNVETGQKLFMIEGHKFDIDRLFFTRDDRFLLTGSVDTTIKFWDMKAGQLAQTITISK